MFAALVALLPVLAGALVIVAPVAYGMHRAWPLWGAVVPFALWTVFAVVALVPPAQRIHLRLWYGCREPSSDERQRLDVAWPGLLTHAGIPAGRCQLMVSDSSELNAYATTGRVVVVTSGAVRTLEPGNLKAVLAHELGHQLGWHVVPVFLYAQLMLPVRALGWLLARIWRPVRRMWKIAVKWHTPFGFLVTFLLAVVSGVVFAVLAVPAAVAFAGAWLSRLSADRAEYQADQVAVRLGLGPQLLMVLEEFIAAGRDGARRGERLIAVSPLLVRRARRVREQLATPQARR